jgi:acyl-coenzyme A thioesterase PaaI-like protein
VVGTAARDPQGAALSAPAEPVFRREGDLFVPTGHARGPWDPEALHGGAPAALVAEAVSAAQPGDDMAVVRLTCEFLGPVPLAPLAVGAEVVRAGRRQQLVEAEVLAGDRTVVRARAVRLRRGDVDLPQEVLEMTPPPGGPPEEAAADTWRWGEGEAFHRTGMELRFAGATDFGLGPALAWLRLARPLVGGEPVSPVARVAAAADFTNGVSRVLDFRDHLFVNTELSIHLHREPAGEWVLLDARTHLERTGAGLAEARVFDARGRIGVAAQALFVDRR